jgi:cardiolipin synthase
VDPRTTFRSTLQAWKSRFGNLGHRTGLPVRGGNRVALYSGGGPILDACRQLIDRAERTLDVEMYIWADDPVGNDLVDRLSRAVSRGVEVRAVYDAFGCLGATGHLERLAARGARVAAFHPVGPWRWRGNPNHRDHRKLLVADDTAAVVSSANWGTEYDPDVNPDAFLDAGVGVKGPVVADLAADFRRVWRMVSDEPIPPPAPPRAGLALPGDSTGDVFVQVLSGVERGDRSPIRQVYGMIVRTARKDLTIASAYFVPSRRFVRQLCQAARRGVSVSLLLPGRTDQRFVQAATRSTYSRLLRAGVRIVENPVRTLHAKAAWVDGAVLVIGSANVDPRSFLHNLELNLNIHSPALVDRLGAEGEPMTEHGAALDAVVWEARPLAERFLQHAAYLFRYWL